MRRRRDVLLLLTLAGAVAACGGGSGFVSAPYDVGSTDVAHGVGTDAACDPLGAPGAPPPPLAIERVLPRLDVAKPVAVAVPPDGSGRLFVVSQPGRVLVADGLGADAAVAVWLDLTDRVDASPGEGGLLSLAFHPRFAQNGEVFVDYTRTFEGQLQSVVSRLRVADPPGGASDPSGEELLLVVDQPFGNHNGGQLAFGPDGFLYIGLGDGGSGGDPRGNGQNRGTLLGSILRIDVDGPPDPGRAYRVPPDNPFVGDPDARPEIWAYGLRNPWRFSFDPATGELWAGDVGQNEREEVDRVVRGGNYGWNVMEAGRCFRPPEGCDPNAFEAPVAEYDHGEGESVTGGAVYRGAALPALDGVYVFGDYVSGTIWGLAPRGATPATDGYDRLTLADSGLRISAFGRDAAGELLVVDHAGALYRLVASDPAAAAQAGWRERLSETDCFADLPARTLVAGLVPYAVAAPLWSDGAAKERALGLPAGERLGFREDGAWALPAGGLAIKTFVLDGRPVETRFLVSTGDGLRFATYRWDDDGADATLVPAGATFAVGDRSWTIPTPADCRACHTAAAGGLLGVRTDQLNRDGPAASTGGNQLEALDAAGWLDPPLPRPPAELARRADPSDAAAPLGDRALSWLDANCAHCHQPGGATGAGFDIRRTTPVAAGGWCGVVAAQGDLGQPGLAVVTPGAPERSALWLRLVSTDPSVRMPPLGVSVVDQEAAALVDAWIRTLASCPAE